MPDSLDGSRRARSSDRSAEAPASHPDLQPRRASIDTPPAVAIPELAVSAVAFPHGGLSGVRHLDPLRIGRGVGDVTVVPVPPLVRWGLGIALGRVLPLLL